MKRDYQNGTSESATFFVGTEIEHTPAYGLRTLFVTDLHKPDAIAPHYHANKCEHIFFGANHSFRPSLDNDRLFDELHSWDEMIQTFLDAGMLCSLDIPLYAAEAALEMNIADYDNFIPQLRVVIPHTKLWNYNTMVKIDDKDFKASNPGVWAHSLHDLMDRAKFTSWREYNQDTIIGDKDGQENSDC